MNSITRNIGKTISLISSSIYRPFYKYTAKDLIRDEKFDLDQKGLILALGKSIGGDNFYTDQCGALDCDATTVEDGGNCEWKPSANPYFYASCWHYCGDGRGNHHNLIDLGIDYSTENMPASLAYMAKHADCWNTDPVLLKDATYHCIDDPPAVLAQKLHEDNYVGIPTIDGDPQGVDEDNPSTYSIADIGTGWEPFGNIFEGTLMVRAELDSMNALGIEDGFTVNIPESFGLKQNFRNPFNPTTTIEFDLASGAFASIILYNVTGREVKTLVNSNLQAGHYVFDLNASELSSGMYFYKLTAQNFDGQMIFSSTKKMVLMK